MTHSIGAVCMASKGRGSSGFLLWGEGVTLESPSTTQHPPVHPASETLIKRESWEKKEKKNFVDSVAENFIFDLPSSRPLKSFFFSVVTPCLRAAILRKETSFLHFSMMVVEM